MELLFELYVAFLKIGTFAFGGGYAMLPLIEREVVTNNSWISFDVFTDIIGISQMTPGPIAINSATFIGYKVSGILGSIVPTLGVVTTSFILVTIAHLFMEKFKESTVLKSALLGMRPALIALILCTFLSLAKDAFIDVKSIIIGVLTAAMLFSKNIHPIMVIVTSAILGFVLYGIF